MAKYIFVTGGVCSSLGKGVAASSLAMIGDVDDQCALYPLLRHEAANVRIRAADALGELGDLRAVEPLIRARERAPRAFKSAARQAIARIQARCSGEGARAGQLSLVECGPTGALSLSEEAGRLTILGLRD